MLLSEDVRLCLLQMIIHGEMFQCVKDISVKCDTIKK